MRAIQAALNQCLHSRFYAGLRLQPIATCQQFLEQAAQGTHLDAPQRVRQGRVLRVKPRGRTKVPQQDLALAVVQ